MLFWLTLVINDQVPRAVGGLLLQLLLFKLCRIDDFQVGHLLNVIGGKCHLKCIISIGHQQQLYTLDRVNDGVGGVVQRERIRPVPTRPSAFLRLDDRK